MGEDTISLDPCDSVDFPNHMTLLGADFVNTENLKGLDKLLGRRFTFVTLPLKFENADGCSCRAIALEECQWVNCGSCLRCGWQSCPSRR